VVGVSDGGFKIISGCDSCRHLVVNLFRLPFCQLVHLHLFNYRVNVQYSWQDMLFPARAVLVLAYLSDVVEPNTSQKHLMHAFFSEEPSKAETVQVGLYLFGRTALLYSAYCAFHFSPFLLNRHCVDEAKFLMDISDHMTDPVMVNSVLGQF
jgi:hypothetical protein